MPRLSSALWMRTRVHKSLARCLPQGLVYGQQAHLRFSFGRRGKGSRAPLANHAPFVGEPEVRGKGGLDDTRVRRGYGGPSARGLGCRGVQRPSVKHGAGVTWWDRPVVTEQAVRDVRVRPRETRDKPNGAGGGAKCPRTADGERAEALPADSGKVSQGEGGTGDRATSTVVRDDHRGTCAV